jgi:hypothetical protein
MAGRSPELIYRAETLYNTGNIPSEKINLTEDMVLKVCDKERITFLLCPLPG